MLYGDEIFPIYPCMEAAIIAVIGINTKLQRCTMKATEWKPYESYVVFRRIPTTSQYHFRFCPMIIANECKYDYRSSSEPHTKQDTKQDSKRLRYGYRIGPEGDRKLPLSIITEIPEPRISLPKDFTWRSKERITGSPTQ